MKNSSGWSSSTYLNFNSGNCYMHNIYLLNSYHVNWYTPTLSLSRGQVFDACTMRSSTLADDMAWSSCSFSSLAAKNDMTCNSTWAPPLTILQHLQYRCYGEYQWEMGVFWMAQIVHVDTARNTQGVDYYEDYVLNNSSLLLVSFLIPPLLSVGR